MQRVIYYVIVIVSVLGIVSCKPGIPRKYLKSDKMADIMYDYHIAEGIRNVQATGDTVTMRAYLAYILKKHKVSQADFDSWRIAVEFRRGYQQFRHNQRLAVVTYYDSLALFCIQP